MGNKGSNKLSNGYDSDVYSKLNKLFKNIETEFCIYSEDKYLIKGLFLFLEDHNLLYKENKGRYIFISLDKGYFTFTDEKIGIVFDLLPYWNTFMSKANLYLSENPIVREEIIEKEYDKEDNSSSNILLLDENNNRYYKGYSVVDGHEIEVDIYNNKLESNGLEISIDTEIYDKPNRHDDRIKLKLTKTN